jgi:hypothetical protein
LNLESSPHSSMLTPTQQPRRALFTFFEVKHIWPIFSILRANFFISWCIYYYMNHLCSDSAVLLTSKT